MQSNQKLKEKNDRLEKITESEKKNNCTKSSSQDKLKNGCKNAIDDDSNYENTSKEKQTTTVNKSESSYGFWGILDIQLILKPCNTSKMMQC